jgi:hypothetical protein
VEVLAMKNTLCDLSSAEVNVIFGGVDNAFTETDGLMRYFADNKISMIGGAIGGGIAVIACLVLICTGKIKLNDQLIY